MLVNAQVEQVKYELRYNPDSSYFDFYLHIIAGSAVKFADRVQFNTQVSIVAPYGTKLSMIRSYMPLLNNQNYNGTVNNLWSINTNWSNPNAVPVQNIFVIHPSLHPIHSYNNLSPNDKIKLFSLKVDSLVGCITDIRIFNDEDDPNEFMTFNNGFTIGGPEQLYDGNIQSNHPPIAGQDETLCAGASHQMIAVGTSSGEWSLVSPHSNVASINNTSPGIGVLNIQSNASGVINLLFRDSLDYDFKCITIDKPNVKITIDSLPCATTRTLTASGGGVYLWTSGNTTQRQIIYNTGTYTVTVTNANGCTAIASIEVNIPFIDSIYFLTQSHVCVGSIIETKDQLGTWVSSNPSVATVNMGIISGISQGTCTITYIYPSGCPAPNTLTVTVNPKPTILSSNSQVCVGSSTTLIPNTGGIWELLTPNLGGINSNFTFTGLAEGNAEMKFTETSTGCSNNLQIKVDPRPEISILGPTSICVGFTTQLSPSTGGVWSSSNGSIVTVSNSGLATGISVGTVVLIYTSALTGCISLPSHPVTVRHKPSISITGSNAICVGATTTMAATPVSGGTWYSINPEVASIDPLTGVVTANVPGFARFYFIDQTGCQSDNSLPVTVNTFTTASFTGPSVICVDQNTLLSPTTGGTWSSSNIEVASISSSGVVLGLAAGTSSLVFTHNGNSCTSAPLTVTVLSKPLVTLAGPSTICVDSTTTLSVTPDSGGIWTSTTPLVASINSSGIVKGISPGISTFKYTSINGCQSDPTMSVAVLPRPIITVQSNELEVGKLATLTANTNVTWYSSDSNIVKIVQNARISGVNVGTCTIYAVNADGCRSIDILITVINPKYTLVGYAFRDVNNNGLFDSTIDSPLPNCAIHIPDMNSIFYTDQTGYYNIPVVPGTYEVYFKVSFGTWVQDSISFTIEIDRKVEYLFASFVPVDQANHSLVTIHPSALLCNTIAEMEVSVFNNTSQKQSGYIALKLDPKTFAIDTEPFPIGAQGDNLYWEYLDLLPGYSKSIKLGLDIASPLPDRDSLLFEALSLNNLGDTLSSFVYHKDIVCEGDDDGNLQSWPDRYGKAKPTLRGERLTYHIHFENTSNKPIHKVEIKNKLDKNIDPSTILVKSASHPVKTHIYDGHLYFIMDSITLEGRRFINPKSGYVTFECQFDPTVADGTIIKNKADIYFDDVVQYTSNEVINTIVSRLPCKNEDLAIDICENTPYITSQNTYTTSGFYVEIIQGQTCDTIQTIALNVRPAIDDSISILDNQIAAVSGGQVYDWYDCNTEILLLSSTANTFIPNQNGQYYVVIRKGDCDTKTACIDFTLSSLDDLHTDEVRVRPNPASNTLYIDTRLKIVQVNVKNVLGQIMISGTKQDQIDISSLPSGNYVVQMVIENAIVSKKFIKM